MSDNKLDEMLQLMLAHPSLLPHTSSSFFIKSGRNSGESADGRKHLSEAAKAGPGEFQGSSRRVARYHTSGRHQTWGTQSGCVLV